MLEKNTLARPYAKAIFSLAKENHQEKRWLQVLRILKDISDNPSIQYLLRDSTLSVESLVALFEEVCPVALLDQEKNCLRLLASKKRLLILPEIATLYRQFCDEAEQILPVEWVSVIPLTTIEGQDLSTWLGEYFGKKIQLEKRVDPSLIGGFWIKAGDTVIDGSLRGRLEQLKETMGK